MDADRSPVHSAAVVVGANTTGSAIAHRLHAAGLADEHADRDACFGLAPGAAAIAGQVLAGMRECYRI